MAKKTRDPNSANKCIPTSHGRRWRERQAVNGQCSQSFPFCPSFAILIPWVQSPALIQSGKRRLRLFFAFDFFFSFPPHRDYFFFSSPHLPYLSPFLLILVFFFLDILSSFTLGLYSGRGGLTSPSFIQPHSFESLFCSVFIISYPPKKKGPHNVLQRWLSARPARLLPVSDSAQGIYLM